MSGPPLTSRDYKRARRTPIELARRRGFGAGLALGLCVALLVYLIDHRPGAARAAGASAVAAQPARASDPAADLPARSPAGSAPAASRGTPPQDSAPAAVDGSAPGAAAAPAAARIGRFDFYRMLPRFRVLVPGERGASAPLGTALRSGAPVPDVYFVQAGSYRDPRIAQRVRARLQQLGYDCSLERVVIGKEVWQRVRVGPIRDPARLARLRATLHRLGIDARVTRSGG